ncbi:MAG: DUF3341 domain-containing protein [Candidatus Glassbacteria bacterium]
MAEEKKIVVGLVGTPEKLLEVGARCRERGWQNLDAFMPYPVHGFEEALGLKKSLIPAAAKTMLVIGAALGFIFQAWTSSVDWPINVGGKPLVSWPAFIPVVFECGVLLAGLTTIAALFHFGRFFPGKTVFDHTKILDERLTDDRFAVIVPLEGNGPSAEIASFLRECGADEIIEE